MTQVHASRLQPTNPGLAPTQVSHHAANYLLIASARSAPLKPGPSHCRFDQRLASRWPLCSSEGSRLSGAVKRMLHVKLLTSSKRLNLQISWRMVRPPSPNTGVAGPTGLLYFYQYIQIHIDIQIYAHWQYISWFSYTENPLKMKRTVWSPKDFTHIL